MERQGYALSLTKITDEVARDVPQRSAYKRGRLCDRRQAVAGGAARGVGRDQGRARFSGYCRNERWCLAPHRAGNSVDEHTKTAAIVSSMTEMIAASALPRPASGFRPNHCSSQSMSSPPTF